MNTFRIIVLDGVSLLKQDLMTQFASKEQDVRLDQLKAVS